MDSFGDVTTIASSNECRTPSVAKDKAAVHHHPTKRGLACGYTLAGPHFLLLEQEGPAHVLVDGRVVLLR